MKRSFQDRQIEDRTFRAEGGACAGPVMRLESSCRVSFDTYTSLGFMLQAKES